MSRLQILERSMLVQLAFAITFFTSGLIINLVQCILYLFLKPCNKSAYRKINNYLCSTLHAQLVFIGDWWSDVELVVFADKDVYDKYCGKEHAYLIMNHTYEIDWLIAMLLSNRLRVTGNTRAYAKKALQYLPVIGWCWKFSDFVLLERSFEKDKTIISKQIKELVDYPDPMWLLIYPEGTRFNPAKHRASIEFSQQKNLPVLKYHLQPRTRGFTASLPPMKGKVPAIYDMLLAFKENDPIKPTMTNLMMGKSTTAYIYLNRIPMEEVPASEAEQDKFLRDLYVKKDKMKESFVQTGDFFATSGVTKVASFKAHRRIYPLINALIWAILVLCPAIYYLALLLFSGKILYFSIGVSIMLFFAILMKKVIGASKASKGSSYGAAKATTKTV